MKREEIANMHSKLEQIKDFERILKELNGDGRNHWWKIVTPNIDRPISGGGTRQRFKEFLQNEIDSLKCELSLED